MAITVTKNNFENEVLHSQKPVLIDFFAKWCGPCRRMMPIIEQLAEEQTDIKVVKVDVDEQPELAAQFGIISIPTLVVMKDGKITNQVLGARPKHEILALL